MYPLVCRQPTAIEQTRAQQLGLTTLSKSDNSFVFGWHNDQLHLHRSGQLPKTGVSFDFCKDWRYHRRCNLRLRKEPIARALALKGGGSYHVWDLTCGTGKDAILLLSLGARVTAFERHPAVGVLLNDAVHRAQSIPGLAEVLSTRFSLHICDAREAPPLPSPDALYLDPMYPEKRKSAKPRKEMALFQELVGKDDDAAALLHFARQLGRVAVKRPLHGNPLAPDATNRFKGKSTRYDMYLQLTQ